MTKRAAKRELLLALSMILNKDDDLIPDEVDQEGPDYARYVEAKEELINEFDRRAKPVGGD